MQGLNFFRSSRYVNSIYVLEEKSHLEMYWFSPCLFEAKNK